MWSRHSCTVLQAFALAGQTPSIVRDVPVPLPLCPMGRDQGGRPTGQRGGIVRECPPPLAAKLRKREEVTGRILHAELFGAIERGPLGHHHFRPRGGGHGLRQVIHFDI